MKQNVIDIVKDLLVDIECAERDGLKEYADKCHKELCYIVENQKTMKFDRYGSPVIPKEIYEK